MIPKVIIRTAHRTYCGANWYWNSRLQTGETRLERNLWYVVKGKGRLKTAVGTYELKRGDCFLLRSWEEHLGTADSDDPVVVAWCCFDYFDERGQRIPPDPAVLPARYRPLANTTFFETLMERLIEAFQDQPDGIPAVQWLQTALNEVSRQDRLIHNLQGIDLGYAEMIDRICRMIQENPGRKFRIPSLAAKASLCVDHFIRVFRRHTGVTPGDYVINSRIEAARGLLQFSSYDISRIAELLGYANVFAFSRQFKERTGKTPTQFRKGPEKRG